MIKLKIITPQRTVFDGNCESITIPGENGEMKIFKGHAPLISNLKIGIISFGHTKIAIEKGFAEIDQAKVVILSEGASLPSEINETSEKDALKNNIQKLKKVNKDDSEEIDRIQDKISQAEIRLKLISK